MEDKLEQIKKYNFWDKQDIDLGYQRISYTQKILDYSDSRLIKVLVGQRRSGKSYILRQILTKLISRGLAAKNTLYINKEFMEFSFLKTAKDLETLYKFYRKTLKPKGRVALFIDEIQNIEGWENFVNSHSQDFTEDVDIYISGSNSKLLSGELATMLSGRYVKFEILPFSFEEFAESKNLEKTKPTFINYLNEGGLPGLFILPTEEAKRNYVSSIKDTIFLRDIIEHYKVKDPNLLESLFVFLINNASSLVSINSIVKYFKANGKSVTYDTISSYIGYMMDAHLIHKSERYDTSGKSLLGGNCKYYANDLAYRNYLYAGFRYGLGYELENIIYLNLRRLGFYVYTGVSAKKEVDFVAKKNDRIVYVQSCYLLADENTVQREYSALESIKDSYEKYIVSLDDIKLPNRNGIKHLQAWEFSKTLQ